MKDLGQPFVATLWPETMMFMNANNTMPVGDDLVPLSVTIAPFDASPLRAVSDRDHAAWCFGWLVDDHAHAAPIGAWDRVLIQRTHDLLVIGRQVADCPVVIACWQFHTIEIAETFMGSGTE